MIKRSQPTQSSVHIIISIVVSGYKSDTGWGADETTHAHVNTRDTVRRGHLHSSSVWAGRGVDSKQNWLLTGTTDTAHRQHPHQRARCLECDGRKAVPAAPASPPDSRSHCFQGTRVSAAHMHLRGTFYDIYTFLGDLTSKRMVRHVPSYRAGHRSAGRRSAEHSRGRPGSSWESREQHSFSQP